MKRYAEDMQEKTEREKLKLFGQLISGGLSTAEAIDLGRQYDMNLSAHVYEMILFKVFSVIGVGEQSGGVVEACENLENMIKRFHMYIFFREGLTDGRFF